MHSYIKISTLNDFIFCPKSIYFHQLYEKFDTHNYHDLPQQKWKIAHQTVDTKKYSTSKKILQWLEVYSQKYQIAWKIDIYDLETKTLIERKRLIKKIYIWYKYQLRAQYFCMIEMWYEIKKLKFYSMKDNKSYYIPIPDENITQQFEKLLEEYRNFDPSKRKPTNPEKCKKCIYNRLCDVSLA